MRIVIVGRRGEKRQVGWLAFLALGVTLWLLVGLGSGGVYFLLCGRWSHVAVLYGGFMGLGVVLLGLYRGLTSPLDKLHEFPAKKNT